MSLWLSIKAKLRTSFFAVRFRKVFKFFGKGCFMFSPFRLDGAGNIQVGRKTVFQAGVWLYCMPIADDENAFLSFGDRCVFGYNNHITAVKHVEIGDDVLTANNVYISDNIHEYENVYVPIMQQPVKFKKEVCIGSGSWIGENVCIIGASVGKNCVIGANAVVTKDIPDYSVAVGNPARVIKRYDDQVGEWCVTSRE